MGGAQNGGHRMRGGGQNRGAIMGGHRMGGAIMGEHRMGGAQKGGDPKIIGGTPK